MDYGKLEQQLRVGGHVFYHVEPPGHPPDILEAEVVSLDDQDIVVRPLRHLLPGPDGLSAWSSFPAPDARFPRHFFEVPLSEQKEVMDGWWQDAKRLFKEGVDEIRQRDLGGSDAPKT